MITFDNKGVATKESQVYFDELKMRITLDPNMDSYQKSSRLQDLYNQYGMQYGTYNRIRNDYQTDPQPSRTSSGSYPSGSFIVWAVIIGLILWGMVEADAAFVKQGIHFSFVKTIEIFFQWVFSGGN